MNTLPTEWRHVGHWSPFIDRGDDCGDECGAVVLVPLPDGLVLVREDCDTCKDGCECGPQGQCRGPYPCPDCLGAPLLAWYRECDRCDGKGVAATGKGWPVAYGTCPAGCVGVDGRRLVKVRRNP